MDVNLTVAMPGALFVVGILAVWAIWGVVWSSRTRALARIFPDSEVISGIRSKALDMATAAYVSRAQWIDGPGAFPLSFTVVMTPEGASFWKSRRSQIVSVPWSDLGPVTFILIPQSPRRFRGINFQVTSETSPIDLPIIAIGRGPFGQFAQSKAAIQSACTRAESWRLAAAARVA